MRYTILRLSLLAVLLSLSLSSFAQSFEVDGIKYKVTSSSDLTVEVTYKTWNGYGSYSGDIVIPETVNYDSKTYRVTSIGTSAFGGCSSLTSITIPSSVTSIGTTAFSDCSSLTSITIPNGVTSIESSVFEGCKGLTSVTIGNSVTSIGRYAFQRCVSLLSVTIPNSVTSIDSYAFSRCSSLTSVIIGNSVTTISVSAFASCSNLKFVTIGKNVRSIGKYAFNGCSLQIVKMLNEEPLSFECSIKTPALEVPIGSTTKYAQTDYWKEVESIYALDGHVKRLPVFLKEEGEKIVEIADGSKEAIEVSETERVKIRFIGNNSNNFLVMKSYSDISDSIMNGNYSFTPTPIYKNNIILTYSYPTTTIKISESGTLLDKIGINNLDNIYCLKLSGDLNGTDILTIRKMTNLKLLDLKNTNIVDGGASYYQNYVTSKNVFGGYFFKEGCNLIKVELPLKITAICDYAFYGCRNLISITIPSNVTSISDYAFRDCSGLASVTFNCKVVDACFLRTKSIREVIFGKGVILIKDGAFYGCSGLSAVSISNSVTSIGQDAFAYCSGLESVRIPNSVTSIEPGTFYGCSGLSSVTIPNSVTSIGQNAFFCCSGLSSVTIPNSVTSIHAHAFSECINLKSLTIPNSVTSIWDGAFYDCRGLSSLTIPNSVTSIGEYAFARCSGLESVKIPNSVTSIGGGVFASCSGLSSVTIPNSVTSIGNDAFSGCSNLKSVTIPNSITFIGNYAFSGCNALASVTSLNTTPPEISNNTFHNLTYNNGTLQVPKGCKTIYWLHPYWENFKNIVEIGSADTHYTLTYTIDGEVYKTYKLKEGDTITPEAEPTKEGYTFSGWSEIPPTMPAHDVTVSGTFSKIKPSQYKSLNDYISESSISKSTDGYSYEITPHIKKIKKVYIDLRESTTNQSYCFLTIYNEKGTKNLEISSKGLSTTNLHNITVNRSYTNIAKLANDKTYNWLYNNPNNKNEVIIDVEQFLGELGVIKSWQVNFGTSCIVNIEKEGSPEDSNSAEAVDLGLSVKWASCNLGADKPEGFGDYYSWGETITKTDYSWETYLWGNPPSKYNNTDGLKKLEDSDDVVRKLWGGYWRMPTHEEEVELYNNCTWEYTIVNNINGFKVIGRNGNSIFLPYAGLYDGDNKVSLVNTGGWYWSSEIYNEHFATGFYFWGNSRSININSHDRCDGHVIRPVFDEGQSSNINNPFNRTKDNVIYNLNGQRLQNPQRGINIINGKKVIIK